MGVTVKWIAKILRGLLSWRRPLLLGRNGMISRDTFTFGAFMGTFNLLYRGGLCVQRRVLKEDNQLAPFLSGGFAALSLLWLPPDDRVPIAVYLFVRAMRVVVEAFIKQNGDQIPTPLREFQHYDTGLFCLTACQILYAYIFEPTSLPPSYMAFLLRAGGKHSTVLNAMKAVCTGASMNREAVGAYCAKAGINALPVLALPFTPGGNNAAQIHACHLLHPGQSCTGHYATFTAKHVLSVGMPLYIPVSIVSQLIWRRKKMFEDPVKTIKHTLKSSIRSALFLALYCGNAWAACCFLRYFNICSRRTAWLFIGPMAGLPILLEEKSRRLELAIYCASPALQSFYTCGIMYGMLPRVPNTRYWRSATQYHVMVLFVFSMGVIMSAHQKDKGHLQPTFSQILKNLMGLN